MHFKIIACQVSDDFGGTQCTAAVVDNFTHHFHSDNVLHYYYYNRLKACFPGQPRVSCYRKVNQFGFK